MILMGVELRGGGRGGEGGRVNTLADTMDYPFKGHPYIKDTSLIRTLDEVPTSYKYAIIAEDTSLIRTHFIIRECVSEYLKVHVSTFHGQKHRNPSLLVEAR